MSDKVTSKNLTYDSKTPKFLAALQAQAAGSYGSPDPLLTSRRRPGLKRSGSAEAEDAPLVVDEAGNVIDARLGADGSLENVNEEKGEHEEALPTEAVAKDQRQKTTGTTNLGRKRKAPKVVGAEEDITTLDGPRAEPDKELKDTGGGKAIKPKKKAKKIKLSFDDEAA
jgi:uncharacterized protein DUF4604